MCGRLIIPTIDGLKFVSMKQTRDLATHARFLAIRGCLLIIVKVLAHPMILWTWILFEAFRLSRTTVSASSWLCPFNVMGVLTFTSLLANTYMTIIIIPISARRKHVIFEWGGFLYDLSIARRSPVNWNWRKTLGVMPIIVVKVCVFLYVESATLWALQNYMFWGKRLMKISLEIFIYDIPTRPKAMFGLLKMHEIHPC